jgi:hypothetical protein
MEVEVLDDSPVLEVLPPNRRRPRPAVIDLTGDGDEVDEAPLPPRPAQRARRVIDLTLDDAEDEDDDEVVIVGPPPRLVRVLPVAPPPAAVAAAAAPPGHRGGVLVAALGALRRQVREAAFFYRVCF